MLMDIQCSLGYSKCQIWFLDNLLSETRESLVLLGSVLFGPYVRISGGELNRRLRWNTAQLL